MDDLIKYNFAALNTLAGDLNGQFKALENLSNLLKSEVSRLGVNWMSETGAQQDQTAQANWDRLFEELRMQLNGLSRGVEGASTAMHQADKAIGATFA